ncbi:DMT family transporter [Nocardiopsis sp. CNR-923]|uniref:DMT family transporter n=1 Tax=Nocardiopsis sp. CNR-923 TaxID=1904965 RepID=UPI00373FD613
MHAHAAIFTIARGTRRHTRLSRPASKGTHHELDLSGNRRDLRGRYALSVGGSAGFTVIGWSISAVVFFLLTLFSLSVALKRIDVGIGYAAWGGSEPSAPRPSDPCSSTRRSHG